jgi:hypothetical protein
MTRRETARDTYLKDAYDRLDKWERKIRRLQEETQQARQLKSAWRQPVETRIEPRLETFRNRIDALSTTDAANQEYMQERVVEAEDELATTYKAIAGEFDVR